jgi:hypothetical protein
VAEEQVTGQGKENYQCEGNGLVSNERGFDVGSEVVREGGDTGGGEPGEEATREGREGGGEEVGGPGLMVEVNPNAAERHWEEETGAGTREGSKCEGRETEEGVDGVAVEPWEAEEGTSGQAEQMPDGASKTIAEKRWGWIQDSGTYRFGEAVDVLSVGGRGGSFVLAACDGGELSKQVRGGGGEEELGEEGAQEIGGGQVVLIPGEACSVGGWQCTAHEGLEQKISWAGGEQALKGAGNQEVEGEFPEAVSQVQ